MTPGSLSKAHTNSQADQACYPLCHSRRNVVPRSPASRTAATTSSVTNMVDRCGIRKHCKPATASSRNTYRSMFIIPPSLNRRTCDRPTSSASTVRQGFTSHRSSPSSQSNGSTSASPASTSRARRVTISTLLPCHFRERSGGRCPTWARPSTSSPRGSSCGSSRAVEHWRLQGARGTVTNMFARSKFVANMTVGRGML
jgi:hypothetical protein